MATLRHATYPVRSVSQCLRLANSLRKNVRTPGQELSPSKCPNRTFHRSPASTRRTHTEAFNKSCQPRPVSYLSSQRRNASSATGPAPSDENAHTEASQLDRTALYDLHLEHGGKMVPFGGYSMPVQYSDLSVGESHKWTREKASAFDVGHMVQHILSGPGAAPFLELVTPTSTASLATNHSTLSCLLHPVTGGIVDDTVITRLGPQHFYVVTNAACKDKDLGYLKEQLVAFDTNTHGKIDWQVRDDWGLVALQGPLSVFALQNTLPFVGVEDAQLETLHFGQCREVPISLPSATTAATTENSILISRGGYTGEDGFEIAIPPHLTDPFTRLLLEKAGPDTLRLAGLGARDSLRLEAGMCLYGHDLDDSTTPIEAGLSWVVGKDRRSPGPEAGGFHGAETILRQLKPVKDGGSGVSRRRVGLVVDGAPAREGAQIVASPPGGEKDGEVVGNITSGCPSPSLGKNIAMGYVKNGLHKSGTELGVVVRGKKRRAVVTKMPFLPSRYWKGLTGTAPA